MGKTKLNPRNDRGWADCVLPLAASHWRAAAYLSGSSIEFSCDGKVVELPVLCHAYMACLIDELESHDLPFPVLDALPQSQAKPRAQRRGRGGCGGTFNRCFTTALRSQDHWAHGRSTWGHSHGGPAHHQPRAQKVYLCTGRADHASICILAMLGLAPSHRERMAVRQVLTFGRRSIFPISLIPLQRIMRMG